MKLLRDTLIDSIYSIWELCYNTVIIFSGIILEIWGEIENGKSRINEYVYDL